MYKGAAKYFAKNRGLAKVVARVTAEVGKSKGESRKKKKKKIKKVPEKLKVLCSRCMTIVTKIAFDQHLYEAHKIGDVLIATKEPEVFKTASSPQSSRNEKFTSCSDCRLSIGVNMLKHHLKTYCRGKNYQNLI